MLRDKFNKFAKRHFLRPDSKGRIELVRKFSLAARKKIYKMGQYRAEARYERIVAECFEEFTESLSHTLDKFEETNSHLIEAVCQEMIKKMEFARKHMYEKQNLQVIHPDYESFNAQHMAEDYKHLLSDYFDEGVLEGYDDDYSLADELLVDGQLAELEDVSREMPEALRKMIHSRYQQSKEKSLQGYKSKFDPAPHLKKAEKKEGKADTLSRKVDALKSEVNSLIKEERAYQESRSWLSKLLYD